MAIRIPNVDRCSTIPQMVLGRSVSADVNPEFVRYLFWIICREREKGWGFFLELLSFSLQPMHFQSDHKEKAPWSPCR